MKTANSFESLSQIPDSIDLVTKKPNPSFAPTDPSPADNARIPQISTVTQSNPLSIHEDPPLQDTGEMDIELDEEELADIDMVSLEEAYKNNNLLALPRDQLCKVHKIYVTSNAGGCARSRLSSILRVQK